MFISCNSPANGLIMTKLVIPILISSYIYEGPDSVSYKFNCLCFLRFSRHYYFVKNGIGSCLCAVASRQWSWSTDCSCWESDQVLPEFKSRSFSSAYSSLRVGVILVLVFKFSILNYIYRLKYFAGIVNGFFTACLLCFGFSDNGNASSVRKGIGAK